MRIVFLILILALPFIGLSQPTTEKYALVDSLIETQSSINAFKAIRILESELEADTGSADYWLRYARASRNRAQKEKALDAIKTGLEINPEFGELYRERGMLFNEASEFDPAIEAFTKAIQFDSSGLNFFWRGIVYQRQRKFELATTDYHEAVDKKLERSELFINLAITLSEVGRYEEALGHANTSLTLNPDYAQAYSTRGKLNLFTYNVNAACRDIETSKKLGYYRVASLPDSICNSNDEMVQILYVADLLMTEGIYPLGVTGYTKFIESGKMDSRVFLNRGYCYYQTKEFELAERDYLQALELPNASKDLLYDNLSLLYFDQKMYEKSIEYSTLRIELNPQNHVPYIDRGLSYRKMKAYKKADIDFNTSLEIKPDFFRAFAYRAALSLEIGEYQNALEDADHALTLNPEYAYGYFIRAQAKILLDQTGFCYDLIAADKYGNPDALDLIQQYCDQ